MPIYVYKFVDTGETIEVQQSFDDDSLVEYAHPTTGDVMPVKKVFQPVGVTFKGSGFFKNDNRGKQSTTTPAASTGESTSDSKSESTSTSESSNGTSSTKSSSDSAKKSSDSSSTSAAST